VENEAVVGYARYYKMDLETFLEFLETALEVGENLVD